MKHIIIALVLFLASVVYSFSETNLKITISKNSSGELILTVEGHTTPVIVRIGDNTVTLYVEENKVNLTALGINELTDISVEEVESKENVEEIDTASGTQSVSDTQSTLAPIPPVSPFISPTPPLSTPY